MGNFGKNGFYLAKIHGRFVWNERPFTRADFDSKFTNISIFSANWINLCESDDDTNAFYQQFSPLLFVEIIFFFFFAVWMGALLNRIEFFFTFDTSHKHTSHTKLMTTQIQQIYVSFRCWVNSNCFRRLNGPSFCVMHFFFDRCEKCILIRNCCVHQQLQFTSNSRFIYLSISRSIGALSIFIIIWKPEQWTMIIRKIR